MSRSIAAVYVSLRFSCACGGRVGLRLVDIADARSVTEKADAFGVVRLALALDVRDHIVRDGFDVVRAKEGVGLGRHLAASIVAASFIEFSSLGSGATREPQGPGRAPPSH